MSEPILVTPVHNNVYVDEFKGIEFQTTTHLEGGKLYFLKKFDAQKTYVFVPLNNDSGINYELSFNRFESSDFLVLRTGVI